MKILFLCGGLEPGKDGVGDYTRKLAGAVIQQGHSAYILSINDVHVNAIVSEMQVEGDYTIPVLRMPVSFAWESKLSNAKQYVDTYKPNLLSLQYVTYSFNKKGLPFSLANWLKQVGDGYKWHIMFHELWLGIKSDAPVSHYVYGFFQKRLISSLVKKLNPCIINTSNRIYQLELQKHKIKSDILPLFSNIALLPVDKQLVTNVYKKIDIVGDRLQNFFILGGFGAVHHGVDLKQILSEQLEAISKLNKQLVYLTFGRASFDKQAQDIQAELKDKVLFCNLGELSEQDLSTILQLLDMGVCGTPKEYIGKSGVYAAMKRHGLSVIIRSGMVMPEYEKEIEQFNAYLESREAYTWDVNYIASKFYENIR